MFSFCSAHKESLVDLASTINDDRKTLARIIAGLFALLGLSVGQSNKTAPQRITRAVHRAVGLVLRPAESAVRRLIVLVSMTIRAKAIPARPMPSEIIRTGEAKARPCFRLFDPRLRLVRQTNSKAKSARPPPRISFFGDGDIRTVSLDRAPMRHTQDDGQKDAAALLRRLEALKSALDDLPRQARRLKRALQRRSASRLKLQGPLRPGYPPGHRIRRLHEIDDVLRRCDNYAREALPPDRS